MSLFLFATLNFYPVKMSLWSDRDRTLSQRHGDPKYSQFGVFHVSVCVLSISEKERQTGGHGNAASRHCRLPGQTERVLATAEACLRQEERAQEETPQTTATTVSIIFQSVKFCQYFINAKFYVDQHVQSSDPPPPPPTALIPHIEVGFK